MNEKKHKIGLLDTAIDPYLMQGRFREPFLPDRPDARRMGMTHGTMCFLILKQYLHMVTIMGISILNNNGQGLVNELGDSLRQYADKGVVMVNMSLGTTHFLDKAYIRKIINHYANKGLVIIAATSNDGCTTYPASFSNVISVAAGESFGTDWNLQRQEGVDFIAPSDHEITIKGVSFRLGKSNSYATPYVTAIVGNLMDKKGLLTVEEVRRELAGNADVFIYSPDWIEAAWISPVYAHSGAQFYFREDRRNLEECIENVDTLILCNKKEVEALFNEGKSIVYLGEEACNIPAGKNHFWSRNLRMEQVMSARNRTADIDIPMICCIFDGNMDAIWWLCELKKMFAEDGYNAFTGGDFVDASLYDLEYLPIEEVPQENMLNFIFWQTCFQQSDLILFGTRIRGGFPMSLVNNPDMVIDFYRSSDGMRATVNIDETIYTENRYPDTSGKSAKLVYEDIISNFEKEDR